MNARKYKKAIGAFLTGTAGMLALFGVNPALLNEQNIALATGVVIAITGVVERLTNKQ